MAGKSQRKWHARQRMKTKRFRVIEGLIRVEAGTPPPFTKGSKRLSGVQARGLAYERKVGKYLRGLVESTEGSGELWLGPWFKYEDANGAGMAQPDALILRPDCVVIYEAKLKQTPASAPQLLLYGTLAEALFKRPWIGVQVFKFPSVRRDDTWRNSALLDIVPGTEHRLFNHHYLG